MTRTKPAGEEKDTPAPEVITPTNEDPAARGAVDEGQTMQPQGEIKQADPLLAAIGQLTNLVGDLTDRMGKLEGKPSSAFKVGAKESDIEVADKAKQDIDPRISKIVEDILGEDFSVSLELNKDTPGFLFTVHVPERLSDVKRSRRPVFEDDIITSKRTYKKDHFGDIVMEEYFPGDRRSRAISSIQSFDAIREHCERIRGYIVSYYQKAKMPLPEFRTR